MKKSIALIVVFGMLAAAAAAGLYSFIPVYFIMGRVNDSDTGVSANGLRVVFARTEEEAKTGIYAFDIVGPTGVSGVDNRYAINAFQTIFLKPVPGETWQAAVEQDDAGYGAGPVDVTFTGKGFEIAGDMTLTLGGGWEKLPTQLGGPQPPYFREIWFNNRLYHRTLVEGGEEFIVNPTPVIKLGIDGVADFGVNTSNIKITVADEDETVSTTYTISADDITKTVKTAAIVSALEIEYEISTDNPLKEGVNTLTFYAEDALATVSTTEICTVKVMSGPAQIIGDVVAYPSPYSPTRPEKNPNNETNCTIQYTLSADADVEIYLYSIAGELIKRFYGRKGQEGGTAGTNKITWDGRTTFGEYAGNGIYACTVFDPSQGKTLAKFKITIVH